MDALKLFMGAASAGVADHLGHLLHADAATRSIEHNPHESAFLLASTMRAIDSGLLSGDTAETYVSGALTASRRAFAGCLAGSGATAENGEQQGAAVAAAISAIDEYVRVIVFSLILVSPASYDSTPHALPGRPRAFAPNTRCPVKHQRLAGAYSSAR